MTTTDARWISVGVTKVCILEKDARPAPTTDSPSTILRLPSDMAMNISPISVPATSPVSE